MKRTLLLYCLTMRILCGTGLRGYMRARYRRLSSLPCLSTRATDGVPSGAVTLQTRRESLSAASTSSKIWDLHFLGTASCIPTRSRGVSSMVLRHETGAFLFDCGEGTQVMMQEAPLKLSKISHIFLTHLHGDHVFGLPGLLCLLGAAKKGSQESASGTLDDEFESSGRDDKVAPVEIFGPVGTRAYLRSAMQFTMSQITVSYRVHELEDVPCLFPGQDSIISGGTQEADPEKRAGRRYRKFPSSVGLKPSAAHGEVAGGRQIFPDSDGTWQCLPLPAGSDEEHHFREKLKFGKRRRGQGREQSKVGRRGRRHERRQSHGLPRQRRRKGIDDGAADVDIAPVVASGEVSVRAAAMVHRVPCIGFAIEEQPRLGRLKSEILDPLIERNARALQMELGGRNPRSIYKVISSLRREESYLFPDGTRVLGEQIRDKNKQGRRIVICGDTSDASRLLPYAQDADVVVHECTNAFVNGQGSTESPELERRHAEKYGHSTPDVAAQFQRACSARKLVLTHFSPRFRGDSRPESLRAMFEIEEQARESASVDGEDVVAAWDLMVLPIPPRESLAD